MMPVSGIRTSERHRCGTRNRFWLVRDPDIRPANERLSQWAIAVRLVGQYVVYLLVTLRIAGALFHPLIRRDGVLERMLPQRRRAWFRRA
jgi:cytochrome b561